MKKFFRVGLGLLIPFALVAQVLWWVYNMFNNLVKQIIPTSMTYLWWYPIAFIVGILIAIVIIGIIFSFIKPLHWIKHKLERYILNKIPVVNKIYNFGKEISDSFIVDIKEDGDLKVVEVMFAGQKSLGVLTDEKNHVVFIPTAPNPLNGFIVKTNKYHITEMTFVELVQLLASLGKINGRKWKTIENDLTKNK